MTVTEIAHAKINLYLDVVGRRADGYHELVTVMQSVSLSDTLTAEREEGEGLSLTTDAALDTGESNLVIRAARAYFKRTAQPFGVRFSLQKNIPMAAGLGGGSADAAAALRALNRLDGNRYPLSVLCEIGATVGADVPFCVEGGTRLCGGIGEITEPLKSRLQGSLVVAIGGEGVFTPWAFAELDRLRGSSFAAEGDIAALRCAVEGGDLAAAASHFYNELEEVILPARPMVGRIKETLYQNGAVAAMMSGSGPSVFGLFREEREAAAASSALLAIGARAFVCKPLA